CCARSRLFRRQRQDDRDPQRLTILMRLTACRGIVNAGAYDACRERADGYAETARAGGDAYAARRSDPLGRGSCWGGPHAPGRGWDEAGGAGFGALEVGGGAASPQTPSAAPPPAIAMSAARAGTATPQSRR